MRYISLSHSSAKEMATRTAVAVFGKQALKVTLRTWGYWRQPEGKSRGPWRAWKSMLRAQLEHQPEKGMPASPQIPTVRKHFGSEVAKSRVVPAAVGVPGSFKTVEMVGVDAISQMIIVKTTRTLLLQRRNPLSGLRKSSKAICLSTLIQRRCVPHGCLTR